MGVLLSCTILCSLHLYDRGTAKGRDCICCDVDGCDLVERYAPRPLVLTVSLRKKQKCEEQKDDRQELSYDADK